MLKRFLYPSNWVMRICKNRKWLHIMFVTQYLQSLPPVLISSQSCLYLSRHFTETLSPSEEFLFHKATYLPSLPRPPVFCIPRESVCCMKSVKYAGFLHFGCLQLSKNNAGLRGCCEWRSVPLVNYDFESPPSLPPWQAKDQRCCSQGRSWMTMSGTLWRWCEEARVCSCL